MTLSPAGQRHRQRDAHHGPLQRGLNGYAGASDTFLDDGAEPTRARRLDPLYLDPANYTSAACASRSSSPKAARFPNGAVHPVGDAAALQAVLRRRLAGERAAEAVGREPGDMDARADGSRHGASAARRRRDRLRGYARRPASTPSFNPGWVTFDVTARVQPMGEQRQRRTIGWRLSQTTTGGKPRNSSSSSEFRPPHAAAEAHHRLLGGHVRIRRRRCRC